MEKDALYTKIDVTLGELKREITRIGSHCETAAR